MEFYLIRYYLPKSNSLVLFVILFLTFSSCQKEKIMEAPKQLRINKILTEQTYGDKARVYTNDSLFCIYIDDNNLKSWKMGFYWRIIQLFFP